MRGQQHVLKVLLTCDEALLIDRIVNRDNITVEEAKKHMRVREDANFAKWKRMYGVTDFWDPKYFDLVINTYSHGPKETLNIVLQALGYFNAAGQPPKKRE
jgi:cytidylate kinase